MTITLDLMPRLTNPLERDLCLRWAPTGTQIDSAKMMLASSGGERVITALVLVGKDYGIWDVDVRVLPVDGAWLVADYGAGAEYHAAQRAALDAARELLGSRHGTVSWCVIDRDGDWSVFEDPSRRNA